jgi:polyisoprenoid-binding protein YceI
MKRNNLFALMTVLVLTPAMFAWTRANHVASILPGSRLWVSGTSTVRNFECKATAVDASIQSTTPEIAKDVMSGQKSVQTVVVKLAPKKIDCANSTMNEHMLKALKAENNPVIEFRLNSYDVARTTTATKGKLSGTLSLGGVQKDITLDATATNGANGALHVVGAYQLAMTDYSLTPPALMMGTMKVGNKVTVKFDLLIK